MESMDARLVAQALNYHGQQLQKVWESERNENELAMLNLKEPSFEIYQQRQKTLRYLHLDSFPKTFNDSIPLALYRSSPVGCFTPKINSVLEAFYREFFHVNVFVSGFNSVSETARSDSSVQGCKHCSTKLWVESTPEIFLL